MPLTVKYLSNPTISYKNVCEIFQTWAKFYLLASDKAQGQDCLIAWSRKDVPSVVVRYPYLPNLHLKNSIALTQIYMV